MLKELLIFVLSGLCLTQAMMVDTRTADIDLLQKQKKIYELFMFIDQTKVDGLEWYTIGRDFDIESNIDLFKDKMIVREFLYRFRLGLLKRDALFSVFRKEHRDELRVMFKLLWSAKDFTTFYKTACWCRCHCNKGMFITALTTVCMYRNDCRKIVLPPMYEVYPHLFFDNEIIEEAHRIKMLTGMETTEIMNDVRAHTIDRDLISMIKLHDLDDEYKLDYFMNDVDLNNYYFYIRNLFPFWITLKDLDLPKDIRGELYYYVHQQLLARYKLERRSIGLEDMEDLDITKKIVPGYISTLVYGNGVSVPSRHRWTDVPMYKTKYVKEVKTIEQRILDAIDSGIIMGRDGKLINLYTNEGLNILGNMIEGNLDSCNTRLYGAIEVLYRDILGVNYDCKHKNCVIPSVMQTFTASLRDPVFYRMYKIIIGFFLRYKCHLPTYTVNDLDFNGVMIENVVVDKLMTYMDKCEYCINNVLTVNDLKEGLKWNIKTKTTCLKHKPFTWNIMVKSDRNVKGIVRIFLGPTCNDVIDERTCLHKTWFDFVELDKFTTDLTVGMNNIRRLSTDCVFCDKKFFTGDLMYKKILRAIDGSEPFTMIDKVVGFPTRLYLPRGRVGGMNFKLFIVMTPIDETKLKVLDLPMFGKLLLDGKTLGFPLDRPIMPWLVDLKNIWLRNIVIYHITDNVDRKEHISRDVDDRLGFRDTMRDGRVLNTMDTIRDDKILNHDPLRNDRILTRDTIREDEWIRNY